MTEIKTTEPTAEPINIAEVKSNAVVSISGDDTLIHRYIKAAREYCETYTSRALMAQTWTSYSDGFPTWFQLVRLPVLSVTSLKYIDNDGNQQTLSSASYRVDTVRGRITRAYGVSWPTHRSITNCVEIAYVAGYVNTTVSPWVGSVPESFIRAIELITGHWYRNREAYIDRRLDEVHLGVRALLDQYRIYHL